MYLIHHGIKGQKWGVKKGPPYPLDENDHTASEKKAKINRLLANDRQKIIASYEKDLPKVNAGIDKERAARNKKIALSIAVAGGTAAALGIGIYCAYKYDAVSKISDMIGQGMSTNDIKSMGNKILKDSLDHFTEFDDGDFKILKAGSYIHRMSAYENVDYSKVTNPLYVAYKKDDVATYMTLLKDWSGTGKRYDVALKAVKDIKMPANEKVARKIFDELWSNNKEFQRELYDTIVDAYTSIGLRFPGGFAKQKISSDPFEAAMYSLVRQNRKSTKMLIDKYKERGYNAIKDYFDAGSLANDPIILFDPSTTVEKIQETLVTRRYKIDTLRKLHQEGISHIQAGKLAVTEVLSDIKLGRL